MNYQTPEVVSPWMTLAMAADYLLYGGRQKNSVVKRRLDQAGVPQYRRTKRTILVRREDLDEMVVYGQCIRGAARHVEELRKMPKELRMNGSKPTAPSPDESRHAE